MTFLTFPRRVALFLVFLLFVPSTLAIGLRPGRIDMNYVSVPGGFEKTFSYHITNTMNVPITAEVYPFYEDGRFEGSLTVSKREFKLGPLESQPFFVTLKLPENANAPGESVIGISAVERERNASRGAAVVQGAVASVFHINGLYEGKYLSLALTAAPQGEGKPVLFTLEARNLGTEDIIDMLARVEVHSLPDDLLVGQVDAQRQDSGPLSSWYSTSFTAEFSSDKLKKGLYKAIATVFYDGDQKQVEAHFRIGEQGIVIVNYPHEAITGKIHRFPISIESQYNFPYQSVIAEVMLKNKETLTVTRSFKTEETGIQPFETKELLGYLDLQGIPLGVYAMSIVITYDNELIALNDDFKVTDEQGNTETRQGARKGGFIAEKPKKPIFTTTNILIGIIVLLLIFNIIWFMAGRRRRPPNEQQTVPETLPQPEPKEATR